MNVIQQLEQEEIKRLGRKTPDFVPGDTVIVNVNVVEGERKRVQAYEGVVIARRNRGLNSSFIVRKISSGEGVERTVQLVVLVQFEGVEFVVAALAALGCGQVGDTALDRRVQIREALADQVFLIDKRVQTAAGAAVQTL